MTTTYALTNDVRSVQRAVEEQEALVMEVRRRRDSAISGKAMGELCVAFEEETQHLAQLRYRLRVLIQQPS